MKPLLTFDFSEKKIIAPPVSYRSAFVSSAMLTILTFFFIGTFFPVYFSSLTTMNLLLTYASSIGIYIWIIRAGSVTRYERDIIEHGGWILEARMDIEAVTGCPIDEYEVVRLVDGSESYWKCDTGTIRAIRSGGNVQLVEV